MLSIRAIARLLGSHIAIYPFERRRLKGVGYNLSVGPYGWSLRTKLALPETADGLFYEIAPGDTALIMTNETVWVSKHIAGTFHSKVDRMSEGLSAISTTLDPEWIGPLLIAISNLTSEKIDLRKNDSFSTLIFHRIERASEPETRNVAGRIDRLQTLGISLSRDSSEWLEEEFRTNQRALKNMLLNDPEYQELKRQFKHSNLWRAFILPWLPSLLVLGSLLYAFNRLAPGQQLGPFIAALIAAIGIGLAQRVQR